MLHPHYLIGASDFGNIFICAYLLPLLVCLDLISAHMYAFAHAQTHEEISSITSALETVPVQRMSQTMTEATSTPGPSPGVRAL